MLLAAASFLGAAAAMVVAHNLYALGIGMPAGITMAAVAVGLGLGDYPKEILLSVLLLPPSLWAFTYLMGEFTAGNSHSWGWGLGALALLALLRAALPSASSKD